MIQRLFLLCVAGCVIAGGCSRNEPTAPGQPRLLSEIEHGSAADGLRASHVMPVALTIDRPEEQSAPLAPPKMLVEREMFDKRELSSNGASPASAGADQAQALSQTIKALRTKLAVISHNLANSETHGFKRSRVLFEDGGYRQIRMPGAQDAFNNYASTGIAVGLGTRVQSTQTLFDQGEIEITNEPLDIAISGHGFFQVIDPTTNNFLYTRAGNFAVNSNGLLVIGSSQTGRLVQPQISLPIDEQAVVVSAEGNVSIQQFGQTQFSQIGQLQLAKFLNPAGLLKVGENLYQESLASGAAVFGQPGTNGLGTLQQNALERSNVNLDDELREWRETERTLRSLERLLAPAHSD